MIKKKPAVQIQFRLKLLSTDFKHT